MMTAANNSVEDRPDISIRDAEFIRTLSCLFVHDHKARSTQGLRLAGIQRMTPKQLAELKKDELVRKRLAKLMALTCFRNTKLEDFHAGTTPSSASGDYSDVKVVTPYGEIPWEKLSRLSDDEMKVLMIEVVHRCYNFLTNVFVAGAAGPLIDHLKEYDPQPKWNDPAKKPSRPRRRSRIAGAAGQD